MGGFKLKAKSFFRSLFQATCFQPNFLHSPLKEKKDTVVVVIVVVVVVVPAAVVSPSSLLPFPPAFSANRRKNEKKFVARFSRSFSCVRLLKNAFFMCVCLTYTYIHIHTPARAFKERTTLPIFQKGEKERERRLEKIMEERYEEIQLFEEAR